MVSLTNYAFRDVVFTFSAGLVQLSFRCISSMEAFMHVSLTRDPPGAPAIVCPAAGLATALLGPPLLLWPCAVALCANTSFRSTHMAPEPAYVAPLLAAVQGRDAGPASASLGEPAAPADVKKKR
jgi:hypothetical protein